MQQVAVVWQLYLLTNSPLSLGLLGAFRVTPILLLALGGGVAADALDRRKLMLASQVGMMLASVGLFAATAAHAVTPAIMYGLAALGGVASAFDAPARQSLLPRLVGAQELSNALSLYNTVYEIAAIAGPALGGAMLAWKGVLPIYAIDVLSFVAVIFALLAMRHRAPSPGLSGLNAGALLEGLRFLRRTPLILAAMLLDFAATFLAGSLLLLPIFADQLLQVGPRGRAQHAGVHRRPPARGGGGRRGGEARGRPRIGLVRGAALHPRRGGGRRFGPGPPRLRARGVSCGHARRGGGRCRRGWRERRLAPGARGVREVNPHVRAEGLAGAAF